ncbi:unnamed protein product [Citrullus colocynthis]|uniref:Uncharacterized protein n=1 Tax=Citrullus colocynthis TaxID=252529 RepID=A0ABP0ZAU7_9ROSI
MSGAMGLAKSSILVLWLSVLVVCVSSVVGARKMLFLAHDSKNSLTTTRETINNRCKYLKNIHCCECFFLSSKKTMINNNVTNFEEKRVVPTGPNPLHNK